MTVNLNNSKDMHQVCRVKAEDLACEEKKKKEIENKHLNDPPATTLCVVSHHSSQPGVSNSHRKIVRSKIIIIVIHNILYLIKLTTLYINTTKPKGQRSEVNATLAHLAPPVKWLPISPRGTEFKLWNRPVGSCSLCFYTIGVVDFSGALWRNHKCKKHPSFS